MLFIVDADDDELADRLDVGNQILGLETAERRIAAANVADGQVFNEHARLLETKVVRTANFREQLDFGERNAEEVGVSRLEVMNISVERLADAGAGATIHQREAQGGQGGPAC